MVRSAVARFAGQTLVLAALLAPPLIAQSPGEQITGVITGVDRGEITVARDGGGEVTVRVGSRTRVIMSAGEAGYFQDPSPGDLKAGMRVHFDYSDRVIDRIHVDEVPANLRPSREIRRGREGRFPAGEPEEQRPRSGGETRVLKVRLLDVDDRRGEIRVDVAGRRESFRVQDSRALRRFQEGDLLVITVEGRGGDEIVTQIKSAAVAGRVRRVDNRRKEVVVEVDGRDEVFGVADERMLDDLRVGDRIRFEFEDRTRGRNVITAIY
jgi:Cu/Ag efflux protein CusF